MFAVQCGTPLGLPIFINRSHAHFYQPQLTWVIAHNSKVDEDYCLQRSKAFHHRYYGATIMGVDRHLEG